ncbi:MAG: phosphoribosylamine--glycine ligase [Planctomycetes bacterium]|nr:phosphoribosylamine--glycine ligase [Planctomycetota bacterium]
MKILVVGSGGREHALAWKISQSPLVKKIYAAPGNPGMAKLAECLPIAATEIDKLKEFVRTEKIDLTVVGPEMPLVNGIVNEFRKDKLKIFGPTKLAAELEGSKVFTRELLKRHGIPSPSFKVAGSLDEAMHYLAKVSMPIVIKADGLASGKGVTVCEHKDMAQDTVTRMMKDKVFGDSGNKVVIEEFLVGQEVSILALTDGKTIAVLEPAQDYKRLMDDNKGPNTGGMGAYSPVKFVTSKMMDKIVGEIIVPTVHAMYSSGRPYQGVLYAGLMVSPAGIKVLEYNVRFGDPETQPLMMRLKSDLVPLLMAVVEQKLDKIKPIEWYDEPAVCVVMTSKGYPSSPRTGDEIKFSGLSGNKNLQAFHAGTALQNNKVVTAGGRVLGITARAQNFSVARQKAYDAVKQISFDGAFYRTDIAKGV